MLTEMHMHIYRALQKLSVKDSLGHSYYSE